MKKLFILGVSAMLLSGSVLTSCSKYEEGSKFTVLTKKARLVGVWTVKNTETNGSTWTPDSDESITFDIKKDGTYKYTYTIGSFSSSSTGTWEFNGDKTKLLTKEDGETDVNEAIIVMLKNKEMKYKDATGSYPTTTTLVQD